MKVDVKFWTIVAVVIAVTTPTIVRPFISQILDGIGSENPIYLLFVQYRSLWISVLVVMIACFCEKRSLLSLGLGLPTLRRGLITSVFGSIAILVLALFIGTFWHWFDQLRLDGNKLYFIGNKIPVDALTPSIFYFLDYEQLLIVAFPEELFYRGYLQTRLSYTFRPAIAVLGAAILFSLIHADRPLMFVHLAVVAPLLGVAYHWSKSVWPGVIIHYVGNVIAPLIFKWIVVH